MNLHLPSTQSAIDRALKLVDEDDQTTLLLCFSIVHNDGVARGAKELADEVTNKAKEIAA